MEEWEPNECATWIERRELNAELALRTQRVEPQATLAFTPPLKHTCRHTWLLASRHTRVRICDGILPHRMAGAFRCCLVAVRVEGILKNCHVAHYSCRHQRRRR